MEIKEYWEILKKDRKVYFLTVFFVVAATISFFTFRPAVYETALLLNIDQSGAQATDEYEYDNYYHLQANEKFAETVVEWLKSPRIAADIHQEAGIDIAGMGLGELSKSFKADKLSSQAVAVKFKTSEEKKAKNISDAIVKIIDKNIKELNAERKDANWFHLVAKDPITTKENYSSGIILIVSLFAGIFLAFWLVMLRHFLK